MKNLLQTVFLTMLTALALVACGKKGSDNGGDLRPLNVEPGTVAGAWQLEAVLINSQFSPNELAADELLQFEINDSRIFQIRSRNNQVTEVSFAKYTLDNGRIMTQSHRRNDIPSFEVLLVTASTLQLRALNQEGTLLRQLNLRRIEPSQIVGGSRAGGPDAALPEEFLQLTVKTPALEFTKLYRSNNASDRGEDDTELSCRYNERQETFSLNFSTYRKRQDSRSQNRSVEAQVILRGKVRLDLSRYEEAANFTVGRGEKDRPGFSAQINSPRSRGLDLSLSRRGGCQVSLKRDGDVVTLVSDCRNVDTRGDRSESGGRVTLRGTCLLQ